MFGGAEVLVIHQKLTPRTTIKHPNVIKAIHHCDDDTS
jgi:hypothetical protein